MQNLKHLNEVFVKEEYFFNTDSPRKFNISDINDKLLLQIKEEKGFSFYQLFHKSKKEYKLIIKFLDTIFLCEKKNFYYLFFPW